MEPDYKDIELEIVVQKDSIAIRVGDKVAHLSSEEAMEVAEALAEAAGCLEGFNSDQDDMDNSPTHPAPETLQ